MLTYIKTIFNKNLIKKNLTFETCFTGLKSGPLNSRKTSIAEIGAGLESKFVQLTSIFDCLD